MKKIYLLTLGVLVGNMWLLNASNPQNASPQNGNDAVSAITSMPNGSKTGSHEQFRQPTHSSQINSAGCIFSDNFNGENDTTSLLMRGYHVYYRGAGLQGTSATWFQGSPATFSSLNGPEDGYLASNYNSVTATNNIDNWLVLPVLTVDSGDVMSFYSKSPLPGTTIYVDSLHVYYSASGDSVPEGTSWVLLGEFEVNLLGIWEIKKYTIPASSTTGRLAIRYAVIDGGPNGANSNFIGIDQLDVYTPSINDLQAFTLTSPKSNCQLSATEQVTVRIVNYGVNPMSNFIASYSIDSGTAIIETIPGPLNPGDTINYTFTATANLSVQGGYLFQVGVTALGDSNLCNNLVEDSVFNVLPVDPYVTPVTMGFEANEDFSAWKIEDTNADGVAWAAINTYPHSGAMALRKAASAANDDDWIFTSCLGLNSGTTYHLDYWYKAFDLVAICDLESSLFSSQNSTSLVSSIMQNPQPTIDTTYQHAIGTFTVAATGTYYIGFHAYSAMSTSAIRIDDINLDNGNFIGINENKSYDVVSVYPNPTNGFFYLSSYKSAKNALVEIYNMQGQKLFSTHFNNLNSQYIDFNSQPNGVYTIRITTDTFVENHSVILSK